MKFTRPEKRENLLLITHLFNVLRIFMIKKSFKINIIFYEVSVCDL